MLLIVAYFVIWALLFVLILGTLQGGVDTSAPDGGCSYLALAFSGSVALFLAAFAVTDKLDWKPPFVYPLIALQWAYPYGILALEYPHAPWIAVGLLLLTLAFSSERTRI